MLDKLLQSGQKENGQRCAPASAIGAGISEVGYPNKQWVAQFISFTCHYASAEEVGL